MSRMQHLLFAATSVLGSGSALAQLPSPPISPAPVTRLEYYAEGNFKRRVEGEGSLNHATTHEYDRLNRRKKTIDARGKDTLFDYNGREDLTLVTDPRGLATQYPRNGLGDVTGLSSPDTGPATHTQDAAGNLKTRLDSRGVLATHSYDALNRLTSVVYSQGGATHDLGWTYDQTGSGFSYGVGRLTSTQYPLGSTTYAYNPQGWLVSASQSLASSVSGSTLTHTVGYGHDAAGRITSITYPSGRVLYIAHVGGVPTSLSIAPQASAVALPLLSNLQFEPVVGSHGPARSWLWHLDSTTLAHERHFDTWGRLIRYPLGGAVRDIHYDAADRISSYTHLNASTGAPVPTLDQSFGYDELGRLTSVNSGVGNWTYAYDDNGNRTLQTFVGSAGSSSNSHTIDTNSNRLLASSNPNRRFTHDAAGNTEIDRLFNVVAWQGTHDLSGRLAQTRASSDGRNFTVARHEHDARGLRVLKETTAREVCSERGRCVTIAVYPPQGTIFVHDEEGRLLGEYDGNSGSVRREYVWLQGMPVAVIDGPPTNPAVAYIQADHLDTPRTVIDRQGRQRWTWLAEPFGHSAPVTNPVGFGVYELNLRMPGQYHDGETGQSYNWWRTYDASVGRYTQSDPIGLQGGINTYAYSENNPVSFTDPQGLATWKGWARSISIGAYQREVYELTSDCACGLRYKIRVTVNYGGPGIGAIVQRWYATLSDPMKCASPDALAGPANTYSFGLAARYGSSYSRTRIGLAESAGWDTVEGLGASVGVAAGISSVEVVEVTRCDDCPKP
jgi:RHS repeat-associated protein